MKRFSILLTAACALACALALPALAAEKDPVLWPEDQRAFYQDGPALLLPEAEEDRFPSLGEDGRREVMEAFLARESGLEEAIRRRQALVREAGLSPLDARAELLFLHGQPTSRQVVDCGVVFRPTELWNYGTEKDPVFLVLYEPDPGKVFRLWLPTDSKRVLYTEEMEYFLDQWEELRRFISGKRFDKQICKEAKLIDDVTGIQALTGYMKERPTNADFLRFLEPPADLAAWTSAALQTPLPREEPPLLLAGEPELRFPELQDQRMVTRLTVTVPKEADIEVDGETDPPELDLSVEGVLEQDGRIFDTFRMRFNLEAPPEPRPVALVVERALRPGRAFLLRLKVTDEIGGARTWVTRSFTVPRVAEEVPELETSDDVVVAIGQQIARERMAGADALILVPPDSDVVIGLWRAEALVTGERIAKVVFLVDGKPQLTRTRPPFSAEVRLDTFPTEQVVRVEGYDAGGELVTADEVVLNQPRGALRVRILEPSRAVQPGSTVNAKAEVVVPEERRVEKVEFLVGEETVAALEKPPWEHPVTVPVGSDLAYLTVVATLDDETRAEDVHIFNDPQFLEEVDVNLVELFTTVTNSSGSLVVGLGQEEFEIYEDGQRQEITRFEQVEGLPLTLGITIDTSGSMTNALYEAQKAASGFVEAIVSRRDRCFAIAFADRPVLLMPPTNDVRAVSSSLDNLAAVGFTALHDALLHSLYYFRGVRGRKALVLLSDGDDTASNVSFNDALEYARHSGVVIYTIGLGVGGLDLGIRNKLKELSTETGGRHFFINKAEELANVYEEIERELRSQYLLAYSSNQKTESGTYREVEVKMKQRGLKARTARGYYE